MGIKEGTGNTQSVKRPGRSAGPESQKQSGNTQSVRRPERSAGPELQKQSGIEKNYPSKETLTEEGFGIQAANRCSDFLNQFRKSPDVCSVQCNCKV